MEAFLDTNFIISCMKKKIDFISQLENLGFKIAIPREVLHELKDLRLKVKREEKIAIDLALKMVENNGKIKKSGLSETESVDKQLIKIGREQGVYIASLDSEVKRNVPNRVVISNSGNKLIVERD